MSVVDLLLPEPVAALPYSVRLAQRRAIALAPKPSDRRAHARRPAQELHWLQRIRLTGGVGVEVRLIDLSEGGALLEIDTPLRAGVQMRLELVGENMDALVPLHIIRCYIAGLQGEATTYRSACAFVHPIELPVTTRATRPPQADFVGTSAALGYLLERCHGGAEGSARASLERQQLLHVLESLRARGAAARAAGDRDDLTAYTVDLIEAVLPSLHRGDVRQEVVAALERQMTRLPGDGPGRDALDEQSAGRADRALRPAAPRTAGGCSRAGRCCATGCRAPRDDRRRGPDLGLGAAEDRRAVLGRPAAQGVHPGLPSDPVAVLALAVGQRRRRPSASSCRSQN